MEAEAAPPDRDVKQVIIIRRDLKMRRGKEIAQGSHASIAFMTRRLSERHSVIPAHIGGGIVSFLDLSDAEWKWVGTGFKKVTCQVRSEEELLALAEKARAAGLVTSLIQDSGHTEFHGELTYTALAIGPDWSDKIDPVTGELELY